MALGLVGVAILASANSAGLSPLLLDRHALLTIRNLTPRNTDRMSKHERDYSEENNFSRTARRRVREKDSDQRKVQENIADPPLVSRTGPRLLCKGTQLGIRVRGGIFCDHRGDVSVANSCRGRRFTRIFPTRIS